MVVKQELLPLLYALLELLLLNQVLLSVLCVRKVKLVLIQLSLSKLANLEPLRH